MDMKCSEAQITSALRSSGYNVEIALEKLLTGGDGRSGGSSFSRSVPSAAAASASSSKKRKCTPAKQSSKRFKSSSSASSTSTTPVTTATTTVAPNRLLLCQRWTVALSKSIRGQISHGETCNFDENYKSALHNTITKVDPMVRFRTRRVEGTLNPVLCDILGPLLRFSVDTQSTLEDQDAASSASFVPLIHLSANALMEDHHLVIGSDIPINLQIYLNDPQAFFELFQQKSNMDTARSESSQFFGKKSRSVGKKGHYDIVEAAFRLLQWAERGEEIDYGVSNMSEQMLDKDGRAQTEDDASSTSTKELEETTTDENYQEEEELESEDVNELNQLVVANGKKSIPELSDPIGFKSNVVLRPYQKQALYWMCRREGLTLKQLNLEGEEEEDTIDDELKLLAELAESSYSGLYGTSGRQVGGDTGISCDCGPVVVRDEDISRPLMDYGKKIEEKRKKYVHHPLWKRRFLATPDMTTAYAFYVNELLGIAAASPPNPPRQCVGGILADAMGLGKIYIWLNDVLFQASVSFLTCLVWLSTGKTVMLMSLILKSKSVELGELEDSVPSKTTTDIDVKDEYSDNDDDDKDEDYIDQIEAKTKMSVNNTRAKSCGTTLVVAPLSLISQWEEEMASKTNLTAIVYYDNSSKKLARADSFSSVDVVVTTCK